MKLQYTFNDYTSNAVQVHPVKVSEFPEELRPTAMRQLIYNILSAEDGSGYDANQLGIIYNTINNINIIPYIIPVCNKDQNAIFLLCTELYNILCISGISINRDYLYNALMV